MLSLPYSSVCIYMCVCMCMCASVNDILAYGVSCYAWELCGFAPTRQLPKSPTLTESLVDLLCILLVK